MYLCINEHPAWTQEDVRLISETVIFIHRKLLPPATKLRQGNVFTSVCDSVHRGGLYPGGVSVRGGVCPGGGLCPRGPLSKGGLCPERGCLSIGGGGVSVREIPIWLRAGSTHPTGMHSC